MRKGRYERRNIRQILAAGLVIIFAAITLIFLFTDSYVRPVVLGYAEKLAEIEATKIINTSIKGILSKEKFDYPKYVEILKDEAGNITAITADTIALNLLVSNVVLSIQQDIAAKGNLRFGVPLGSISGSAYFIGRGPKLPMDVSVSTAVHHSVTSEFSDAGVNQTLHRMVLHISTSAFVLVPFYTSSTTAEVQVPLCETVIVGKVPDAFTVVIEGSGSDMSGKIFDYSAGVG